MMVMVAASAKKGVAADAFIFIKFENDAQRAMIIGTIIIIIGH